MRGSGAASLADVVPGRPWHFLNFLPLPQGQVSLRPVISARAEYQSSEGRIIPARALQDSNPSKITEFAQANRHRGQELATGQ